VLKDSSEMVGEGIPSSCLPHLPYVAPPILSQLPEAERRGFDASMQWLHSSLPGGSLDPMGIFTKHASSHARM